MIILFYLHLPACVFILSESYVQRNVLSILSVSLSICNVTDYLQISLSVLMMTLLRLESSLFTLALYNDKSLI